MNIIIRADGSKSIGMGHLTRARTLAITLKSEYGIKSMILSKSNPATKKFFQNSDIPVRWLSTKASPTDELGIIKSHCLSHSDFKMVIVDLLDEDPDGQYLSSLKEMGLKTCVITDDTSRRKFSADLVFNGNPCQMNYLYESDDTDYCVGPKYFIMDPLYALQKRIWEQQHPKRILVTVGGSDHNNLLLKILDAWHDDIQYQWTVVTSECTGYLPKLRDKIKSMSMNIKLLVDVPSLVHLWGEHDLAITAGGNTLFERIASGCPGASICQLTRQMEIANQFERLGVNKNLGFHADLTPGNIRMKMKLFFFQHKDQRLQVDRSKKYVDGRGLQRVCQKIQEKMEEMKRIEIESEKDELSEILSS